MLWEVEADLGKIQKVANLARIGARSSPANLGNRLILGRALMRLGKIKEAATSLYEAIAALAPAAELEMALAEALLAQDLIEEALAHVENALAIAPENLHAKRVYFDVLALLKRWDEIRLDMTAVSAYSFRNPRLMQVMVESLGPAEALKLCDSQLTFNPAHTNAKFLKAVMLAKLGRVEEARDVMPLDRLIEIQTLATPAGYAGDQTFRNILAEEIRCNPTLVRDPKGKTTRDGSQTRCLRQSHALAIEALHTQIKQAVDTFEKRLSDSEDEFARGRPREVRLRSWAVIQGSAGRQKPHRHPDGWLSGVYYVTAPRLNGQGAFRGPLIMGALDPEEHGVDPPWGTRQIEPVPGRLVLFPSYVPHATEPSGVDGERICVAFDVVPLQ